MKKIAETSLLACGIKSSLLYAVATLYVANKWTSYNSLSRTISELSAIGAPTRSLWVLLVTPYTFLMVAFACGVWICARSNRALRIVGGLLALYAALGVFWPFAPMHLRDTLAAGGGTWTDSAHIALGAVTVVLMFAAVAAGATAFGAMFRAYSIATLLTLAVFGVLTFLNAPRIGANLPTPWMGLWERINLARFPALESILAMICLRMWTSSPQR